ncbi:MAG: DUF1634 domain-containing protein [Elusimicrobia bacterium]|nr:DUF1634 domain-containing protein [Elusimicrobiota bacterium]
MTGQTWSEAGFGRLIQRTLQAGVACSVALLLLGGVLGLASSAASGAVLGAGILVLVLTPVARVAMLIYGFHRSGEQFFALASLVVLLLLALAVLA